MTSTTNFLELANKGIQGLQPYEPGKPIETLARELNLNPDEIVKLASNENPLGASPKVLTAIQAAAQELTRYPDGSGHRLKAALAAKYQLQPENFTLGNGSNDLLDLIGRCWLEAGRNAVYSQYAFAVYPITTQAQGAEHKQVAAVNWGHNLAAMAEAVDAATSVVFLANPNNPTGTSFSHNELVTFLQQVPSRVLVVLDEAYTEFVTRDDHPKALELLAEYPNLIICRTLAKAYGLAGLRLGYAISSPEIAEVLNRIRQPFNVNSLALEAGLAALEDRDYLEQTVALNNRGKQQLEAAFNQLGLNFIPSQGNFICVEIENAAQVNTGLLTKGVIVRPLAGYQMPNHLRVSIGTEAENARFIEALTQVLPD